MPKLRYIDTVEAIQVHKNAEEFADEVLKSAIKFAGQAKVENHGISDSNTLVSKHVDAQLEYVRNSNYLFSNSWPKLAERTTEALEALAAAHAGDG